MDLTLAGPREVLKLTADRAGGWLVDLACGHTIWSAVAPQEAIPCGLCAQRLIRQIHELCAKQTPPPFTH